MRLNKRGPEDDRGISSTGAHVLSLQHGQTHVFCNAARQFSNSGGKSWTELLTCSDGTHSRLEPKRPLALTLPLALCALGRRIA